MPGKEGHALVCRFNALTPGSGALAAAAAYAALIVLPGSIVRLCSDHVSSPAESRAIVLDDGSTIHLAPDTAIAVTYTEHERRVRVLAGSGTIAVARDPERPFIVVDRDVEAIATSARFSMMRQNDSVVVTVAAGSVRVGDTRRVPTASQEVGAGFTLRVLKSDRLLMATLEQAASGD